MKKCLVKLVCLRRMYPTERFKQEPPDILMVPASWQINLCDGVPKVKIIFKWEGKEFILYENESYFFNGESQGPFGIPFAKLYAPKKVAL